MSTNNKKKKMRAKRTKNVKKKNKILTKKNKNNNKKLYNHNNLKKKIKKYNKKYLKGTYKKNKNYKNKKNKKYKFNNDLSNKLKQTGGYASADQCAGDINQKLMGNPPVRFKIKRSEDTAIRQLEKQSSGNILDAPGPPPALPSDCVIL